MDSCSIGSVTTLCTLGTTITSAVEPSTEASEENYESAKEQCDESSEDCPDSRTKLCVRAGSVVVDVILDDSEECEIAG